MHFYPEKASGWQPKVSMCSAIESTGTKTIWEMIEDYIKLTKANTYFNTKRNEQNKFWLMKTIEDKTK